MKNMILKPDFHLNYKGWKKIDLSGSITTNITDRKYDYLLSLLSLGKAEQVAKNGFSFVMIGNAKTDIECKENETVISITDSGISVVGQNSDAVSNGVKMLVDMQRIAPEAGAFPLGEFHYTPKMSFRGVHMCVNIRASA